MNHPKLAAVFATMNRANTAVTCVRALAAQTLPPDLVVVADNVSSDETAEQLENLKNLPFPLLVLRMKENRGNAGGVQEAMDLAFTKGADAVWILDDDSWPRPEALHRLTIQPWCSDVVRIPMQVNPEIGRFTWPLQIKDSTHEWKIAESFDDIPDVIIFPTRNNWTGALITRHVREVVGPVPGYLFIRGEDEAYPWMMEKMKIQQEAVKDAILDHVGPKNLIHSRFFGKQIFFEQNLADWKLYYKIRNMVWLKRKQSGIMKSLAMAVTYAFATAWIDGAQRLPLVWEAVCDGWMGRLGKWRKH